MRTPGRNQLDSSPEDVDLVAFMQGNRFLIGFLQASAGRTLQTRESNGAGMKGALRLNKSGAVGPQHTGFMTLGGLRGQKVVSSRNVPLLRSRKPRANLLVFHLCEF